MKTIPLIIGIILVILGIGLFVMGLMNIPTTKMYPADPRIIDAADSGWQGSPGNYVWRGIALENDTSDPLSIVKIWVGSDDEADINIIIKCLVVLSEDDVQIAGEVYNERRGHNDNIATVYSEGFFGLNSYRHGYTIEVWSENGNRFEFFTQTHVATQMLIVPGTLLFVIGIILVIVGFVMKSGQQVQYPAQTQWMPEPTLAPRSMGQPPQQRQPAAQRPPPKRRPRPKPRGAPKPRAAVGGATCPYCNASVPAGSVYCTSCYSKIKK